MPTEDTNKAIIVRWIEEAWNNARYESASQTFSDDYVAHVPGQPVVRGPEGPVKVLMMQRQAFPDLHASVDDMVAEGDKVAWRFTIYGTHNGPFMGIAPTGKQVQIEGIGFSRFENGRFVEHWAQVDTMGMLRQLGALAPQP